MEVLSRGIEQASSLTVHEYMGLKLTWMAIKDPTYHCGACQTLRPGIEPEHGVPMLAELRRRKGCEGGKRYEFDRGRIKLERCPGNFYSFWAEQVIGLWDFFRTHGVLPEAGGVMDQEAKMMEAFRILDEESRDKAKKGD